MFKKLIDVYRGEWNSKGKFQKSETARRREEKKVDRENKRFSRAPEVNTQKEQ